MTDPVPGPLPGVEDGVEDGVGLTALMVAAARAIETHRDDALVHDPYAERFVRAAQASAHWPVHPLQVPDGEANPLWGRLGRYFGLRTRVFDDFALHSARSGARQIVLLGAGLDTRAFRLDWPTHCTVFELDRAEVLAFKHEVLASLPTTPQAARTPLAVDLRTVWAETLTDAGFDRTVPTAWLAEGLLLYLPAAAERHLIDTVHRLSAPGSALAYEAKLNCPPPGGPNHPIYAATRRQTGIDLLALFANEPRPDSATDLTRRGWSTSTHTPYHFTRHHTRGPLPEPNDALSDNRWTFATRPATTTAQVWP